MAHGMLSSVDAIVTFEVARIWNWHVDRRLFLISHAWNMHRPPNEHSRQPTTQLGSVSFIDTNVR